MLEHCPANSLVRAQVFDYKVLCNAQADRDNDLAQAFRGMTVLWYKVIRLTHCYDITTSSMFRYNFSGVEVLSGHHAQRHLIPEQKSEELQPIFPEGLENLCNQPIGVGLGHNQCINMVHMYHSHYFSPFLNNNFLG